MIQIIKKDTTDLYIDREKTINFAESSLIKFENSYFNNRS